MNSNKNIEIHNCTECGYTNVNESIDLWSLCVACSAHIISNTEVLAMDFADEVNEKD